MAGWSGMKKTASPASKAQLEHIEKHCRTMKPLILPLLVALLAFSLTAQAELNWTTDLPAAIAQAKKEKKLVLLDFTGSDWCGYCIQLKKDVFDTKEFEAYAKQNLVLVEVDFPRKKKQTPELTKANESLKEKYTLPKSP